MEFDRRRFLQGLGGSALVAGSLATGSAARAAAPETPVRELGSRLELFADDWLIAGLSGEISRQLARPTPQNVALANDAPWEGNACNYMTVFRDGDLYRMYYRGADVRYKSGKISESHPECTCYAESRDGVTFTRPKLGLFEFSGTRDNNVILTSEVGGTATHNFCPFVDARPGVPADERYKAIGGTAGDKPGLLAFFSADGIRWKKLREEPVITVGAFDSQNLAFWDAERQEYRAYLRDFRDGRDIRTCTSRDFVSWTEPTFLEYPAGRVSELYTNQIAPYHRAPHLLLGFPTRYVDRGWTKSAGALPQLEYRKVRGSLSPREGTAVTEGMFIVGRDRQRFFVWPEAFVRPGLRLRENWFYGDNYQSWGLVETASAIEGAPPELSFYVSEATMQDMPARWRRHTVRVDGFVAVRATLAGGELLTHPLTFTGERLLLNYSTGAAGSVQVEVQGSDGAPLPGYSLAEAEPMYGDSLAQGALWQAGESVGKLAGQTVRLRFVLKDADLYSLKFAG